MKKICLLTAVLCFFGVEIMGQTVAQFRGEDRKGVYPDQALKNAWPVEGPQLLWAAAELGNGYGSPSITGERIYITGEQDSTGYLYCLSMQGKILWKTAFGSEWVRSFPGSRSAPTVTADRVYCASGFGRVYCFDAASGKQVWNRDLIKDFHGQYLLHGHAEALLIDDDKLFFVVGGKDTNVVAVNRNTGNLLWCSSGRGERAGYNSPVMVSLPGRTLLLVFSAYSLMGIDASNGKLLWAHEQDNTPLEKREPGYGDTHSNCAWYENGCIYYIAGDGNGAVKLELSNEGSQVKQLWRNSSQDNYMGGFVKLGNAIYTTSAGRRTLEKLDANTGLATDSLKIGTGAIISSGNFLIYYNQRGEMMLINSSGGKMEVTGKFKIAQGSKEHFSHPVLDRGVLYIRHGSVLMAYKLS